MKINDIVNRKYKRILFLDFESRSKIDLPKLGVHKYASHSSTKILLTAYAFDDGPVTVNELDAIDDVFINALYDTDILKVAHNAEFDMALTHYVLGVPLDIGSWLDTAYMAAYYAHPRGLKNLAKRLNLTEKGDGAGILTFSIPKKKRKGDDQPALFSVPQSEFNEPSDLPTEWADFIAYAGQDVETMREAFHKMAMLPPIELHVLHMTIKMNFKGVPFDNNLSIEIYKRAKEYSDNAAGIALDKYGVGNLRSTKQVQDALRANGVDLPSLNKKERGDITHEILDLRDVSTGAAFSKIPKALERVCATGRIHGEFVGHGAHTGRWTSKGVQLQNWARIQDEVSTDLSKVKSYDHLRQHMRLCLGHVPHVDFTYADLAQIEARIVAWLAGSKWRMSAFANDVDIYARSAEKMFNLEKVTKADEARHHGKAAELGFGYGGGHMAIKNIQPTFYEEQGEPKVRELVDLWRSANPEITELWRTLENGLLRATKMGGATVLLDRTVISMRYDGRSAKITLPSGRALYYRGMHTEPTKFGKRAIAYMDYSMGGTPRRVHFWGGVILENITQAIARDVLVDIMHRVDKLDLDSDCIATVHDEVWYLNKKHVPMLDILLEEMARPITWAKGLVTKGDGFTSDRYRK